MLKLDRAYATVKNTTKVEMTMTTQAETRDIQSINARIARGAGLENGQELTLSEVQDLFPSFQNATSGITYVQSAANKFAVLAAYVNLNDEIIDAGFRLKAVHYGNSFIVQANREEITAYYKKKASNALTRAYKAGN